MRKDSASRKRSSVEGARMPRSSQEKSRRSASRSSNEVSRAKSSRGISRFLSPKLVVALLLALLVLFAGGCAVDHFVNRDKVHSGVSVGEVDLSGKTVVESKRLIEEAYSDKLNAKRVIIYSSDDLVGAVDVEMELRQEEALAEQISVEQARENKQIWVADASSLSASIPAEDLAQEAYLVGREDGGFLARLGALVFGKEIDIRCDYDPEQLDALIYDIDETLGTSRVDCGIVISDGFASVVTGSDGNCMDREEFVSNLNAAFLESATPDAGFVAKVYPSAMRITEIQAQVAADYVNSILDSEVSFVYDGQGWGVSKSALGRWITTEVVEKGSSYVLDVLINEDAAKPGIVSFVNEFIAGQDVVVDFEKSGSSVSVVTDGKTELPRVEHAIQAVDEALFGPYRDQIGLKHDASLTDGSYVAEDRSVVQIVIQSDKAEKEVSFDDALDMGLVMAVSSYTTTYNNNESTQNRVHNIHLAADLINNGIIQSGGGTWSFNDRAGNCNAERGFLGAGVIFEDEVQDAVGGGICQVATTIFNAVYEAGYGIDRRYAHSLHMEAYPDGRDAAVSYPELDLVWRNDTASDVLLRCTYTDDSVTVTLYSVDPGYSVSHKDGEWKKTKDHATKKVVDETLASGQSFVETEGTDAMQFVVFRTVTDASGNVVYDDTFYSSYGSITEVIRVAPDYKETEKDSEEQSS